MVDNMKKNTRKIVRLTNGEKLLYAVGTVCFVLSIFIKVFSSASISNLKMNIEEIS